MKHCIAWYRPTDWRLLLTQTIISVSVRSIAHIRSSCMVTWTADLQTRKVVCSSRSLRMQGLRILMRLLVESEMVLILFFFKFLFILCTLRNNWHDNKSEVLRKLREMILRPQSDTAADAARSRTWCASLGVWYSVCLSMEDGQAELIQWDVG